MMMIARYGLASKLQHAPFVCSHTAIIATPLPLVKLFDFCDNSERLMLCVPEAFKNMDVRAPVKQPKVCYR